MTAKVPIPRHLTLAAFTLADGMAGGLGRKRLYGADLFRPFSGVRTVAPSDTVSAMCRAYMPRLSADAVFCGSTAAVVLGVPLPSALESALLIHVAVGPAKRAPRLRGVIGHKLALRDEQKSTQLGLPITSPTRTWCDLALELSLDDLIAAGDFLIHRRAPFTTVDELARAITGRTGHRGVSLMREALPQLDDRSESRRESLLRVVLIRGGIQGVRANFWVALPTARVRYRVDFAIPELKVAIEYQSDYHRDLAQWRADMTRISRLQAHGWIVIQVNADDLHDPRELVARIRLVISQAATR